MFSLLHVRFVPLCSLDFDVLRAQRIIGFFILITHKSTWSEIPITRMKYDRALVNIYSANQTKIFILLDQSDSGNPFGVRTSALMKPQVAFSGFKNEFWRK